MLQLLQENPTGLNISISKNLIFQLCKAIEKCHSLEIIHRGNLFEKITFCLELRCNFIDISHIDVKPENLLIDKNNNLKLCDFGKKRKL